MSPEQIKAKITAFLGVPPERLVDEAVLVHLVSDSFILVQLVIELQEAFGVRLVQEDLKTVHTVKDLLDLLLIKSRPQSP